VDGSYAPDIGMSRCSGARREPPFKIEILKPDLDQLRERDIRVDVVTSRRTIRALRDAFLQPMLGPSSAWGRWIQCAAVDRRGRGSGRALERHLWSTG